jgi:hypothetical protein
VRRGDFPFKSARFLKSIKIKIEIKIEESKLMLKSSLEALT